MKSTTKSTAQARPKTGAADTINPDHINMHRFVVLGVIASLAAAILTSASGLIAVAGWQLLPVNLLWVTIVMIDVPLVMLTLARGALAKRGVSTPWLLVFIIGLTAYSSLANFAHTVAEAGFATLPQVIGAVTNALAPWFILLMTEVLWLVTTKQKPSPAVLKARADAAAAKVKPKRTRAPRSKPAPPAVEDTPLAIFAEPDPEPQSLGVA